MKVWSVKLTMVFLIFLFSVARGESVLFAQDAKPSRQVAVNAWTSGDYEKAYNNFNGLLMMYSRDPLYAYYTGACLVKLQRDPQRSVTLLRSALNSSQNVKTIPDEVWFYYGRALQMTGNYQEATNAYEKYSKIAGRKKAQEYNVQFYLAECSGAAGIEKHETTKKTVRLSKHSRESRKQGNDVKLYNERITFIGRDRFLADSLHNIADGIEQKIDDSPVEARGLMRSRIAELEAMAGRYKSSADSVKTILGVSYRENQVSGNPDTKGNQLVSPDILTPKSETVDNKISGEYDQQLTRAMKLQYSSDSLFRVAAGLRRQSENLSGAEKSSVNDKAAKLEKEAQKCQSDADRILMKLEPGMPDTGKVDADTIKEKVSIEERKAEKPDTTINKVEVINESKIQPLEEAKKTVSAENLISFRMLEKPGYSASNPVPVGQVKVKGLIYCIQLAAFKNPVSPSFFRNFYPVFGIVNNTNGVTYYYTGMFRRHQDASSSLSSVRTNGFADAFIVAMIDNVQVSMDKAAQAESYWSQISLTPEEEKPAGEEVSEVSDTVTLGRLIFRAEVLRSVKPVKSDVIDKIELMAGNKPLDIIKNNKGETIILIGKFITFESSEEYVSLLIRNGYNAARTAAWVGNNEIPVEKARELLKKVSEEAPAY